jgi:hypothetical protein
MRCGTVVLGFSLIVLIMTAGCSSQAPSRTVASAPHVSATTPASPAQPEPVSAVQTFSKDGTSLAVSIDSITSSPGTSDRWFSLVTVNFTLTNTGTEALAFTQMAKIITEHPSASFQCSDERVCNTTKIGITFVNPDGSEDRTGNAVLYPGIPRKGTSKTWFEKREYEALKQGMLISFSTISVYSPAGDNGRYYNDYDNTLVFPVWKIDFAKDVTILPGK